MRWACSHDHSHLPRAALSTHAFAMDCVSRSLAAHDSGSPEGDQEAQCCEVSLLPALEKSSHPPTIRLYILWHACASPPRSDPESSKGLNEAQIFERLRTLTSGSSHGSSPARRARRADRRHDACTA